jgi:predicted dehydrogenase
MSWGRRERAIWARQAGKEVYVENPSSYNMLEARQIMAASRKYNRIVQHGTNGGSSMIEGALDFIGQGVIGH